MPWTAPADRVPMSGDDDARGDRLFRRLCDFRPGSVNTDYHSRDSTGRVSWNVAHIEADISSAMSAICAPVRTSSASNVCLLYVAYLLSHDL